MMSASLYLTEHLRNGTTKSYSHVCFASVLHSTSDDLQALVLHLGRSSVFNQGDKKVWERLNRLYFILRYDYGAKKKQCPVQITRNHIIAHIGPTQGTEAYLCLRLLRGAAEDPDFSNAFISIHKELRIHDVFWLSLLAMEQTRKLRRWSRGVGHPSFCGLDNYIIPQQLAKNWIDFAKKFNKPYTLGTNQSEQSSMRFYLHLSFTAHNIQEGGEKYRSSRYEIPHTPGALESREELICYLQARAKGEFI